MALKIYRDSSQPAPPLDRRRVPWGWQGSLAIGITGFAAMMLFGLRGAGGLLFSAWLLLIGGILAWSGYQRRQAACKLSVIAGVGMSLLGILGAYVVAHAEFDPTGERALFDAGSLITLGVTALFGFVLWDVLRTKWTMLVVAGPSGIKHQKGLPTNRVDQIQEFLEKQEFVSEVRIHIKRVSPSAIRLRCDGDLSAGQRQRIRNFLYDTLA